MTYELIDTVYSAHEDDFATYLVGKSIVEMTEDTLVLSDGTRLTIESGGDCCAYFDGEFKAIDLNDNVITRVTEVDAYGEEDEVNWENDSLFNIHIYTANTLIGYVEVTGSEGSGYYGSSINLSVSRDV